MSFYLGAGLRTGPTESLVLKAADQMETNGWKAAGYRYINLDAGWSSTNRLPDGRITWNTNRFPSGLPSLISRLHARGFKVGTYTEPNLLVHAKDGAGSLGHFEEDAQSFADWGFDYIKFDPRVPQGSEQFIQDFTRAVANTGRPMFLQSYLQSDFGAWVPQNLNSFRKGLDIAGSTPGMIWGQFMSNLNGVARFAAYVRPGFYLDMETIPLSLGSGLHQPEMLRGMISMYAILASPMFLAQVENPAWYPSDALAQDRDIIGINQDPAVNPPRLAATNNTGGMVWLRALGDPAAGRNAVCFFNSQFATEQEIALDWTAIPLPSDALVLVYDCWDKTHAFARGSLSRKLRPGSASVVRLDPWPDAGSEPRLRVLQAGSGNLVMALSAPEGEWVVESSLDLRSWGPVSTNLLRGMPSVYSVAQLGGSGARFYRASKQNP